MKFEFATFNSMKKIFTTLCATFVMLLAFAQEGMEYFLPADVSYDKSIPTPEEFFKQQLGEWHLTHNQVLSYMNEIARISDRAIIYEYARSYENKPLVHLVFTSEDNHAYLEDLKIPSISKFGVDLGEFEEKLDSMAEDALRSGAPNLNPRVPNKEEIFELYRQAW